MPTISFTKMHGLGNDFVIIDAIHQSINQSTLPIKQLSNRQLGIGFDQLLLIEPGNKADFFCRIYNADGSEAEQCGNGLRCIARFLHESTLHPHATMTIATKAGVFSVTINDYDHIAVSLGIPHVEPTETAINIPSATSKITLHLISVGNPHGVILVNAIDMQIVAKQGLEISTHKQFPAGINVGFMRIINPHHIELRTFERGTGITNACGSNACAAVAAGISQGLLQSAVDVDYQYGKLHVEWNDKNKPIVLSGPATMVYSGVFGL